MSDYLRRITGADAEDRALAKKVTRKMPSRVHHYTDGTHLYRIVARHKPSLTTTPKKCIWTIRRLTTNYDWELVRDDLTWDELSTKYKYLGTVPMEEQGEGWV